MTTDLLNRIASVLDIIGAHCDANEGRDIWPSGLAFAGDRLGVALGLDIDARWQDVAEALRALARPDVGLPEGWRWDEGGSGASASNAEGYVQAENGRVWIDDGQDLALAPASVVRAVLLRAAGVAS